MQGAGVKMFPSRKKSLDRKGGRWGGGGRGEGG